MNVTITMKLRKIKTDKRREIDSRIREILGGKFDEVDLTGASLYRRVGTVEIFDTFKPAEKTIYGDTSEDVIQALREVAKEFGVKIA